MKNNVWFFAVCVLMFFVGYNTNKIITPNAKYKVATLDVQSVLNNSKDVKQLNVVQNKQTEELNNLISKAQNELINEKDKEKYMLKQNEFRKQIEEKKILMEKNYAIGLEKITTRLKEIVNTEAKKSHYNLVLPNNIVISGGEDITSMIAQKIE